MRRIIFSISLAIPSLSFALFCPNNFNLIAIGDSIDKVTQACGKPAKEETKEADIDVPQEWTYYISQDVRATGTFQGQGTVKTTISFNLEGKAINIGINGIGVGSSTICGSPIALGQTRDAIKAICGAPAIINKAQTTDASGNERKNKIVTYTYTSTPPVVMVFENGILKSFANQ